MSDHGTSTLAEDAKGAALRKRARTAAITEAPAATTEAAPSATPEPGYGSLFDANRQAFERWVRGMLEISQQVTQFTQMRFQEDAAAWTKLASCRSPEEAFECQRNFAERTAKQYSAAFERMSQIVAGISNGASFSAGHESSS